MASEHAECERVLSAKDDDAILRLTSAGSIGDVRRAYRTLALAIHPDRCGHPSATAAFQRLQAAFHRVCERAGAPGLGGAPDAHAAGRAPPRAAAASAFSHASDGDDCPAPTRSERQTARGRGRAAERPRHGPASPRPPPAKRRRRRRGSLSRSSSSSGDEASTPAPPRRAASRRAAAVAAAAAFRAAGADDISSEPDGDDEGSVCNVCAAGGELLLCDGCPCAFHVECVWPPMRHADIPAGEWLCTACRHARAGDTGADQGRARGCAEAPSAAPAKLGGLGARQPAQRAQGVGARGEQAAPAHAEAAAHDGGADDDLLDLIG